MTEDELESLLNDAAILDTPFRDGKFYVEAYDPAEEDYLLDGNADWQYSVYVESICVMRTIRVSAVIQCLEDEGYTFFEEE